MCEVDSMIYPGNNDYLSKALLFLFMKANNLIDFLPFFHVIFEKRVQNYLLL